MKKRFYSLDILKFCLSILIVAHHYQQDTGVRFSSGNFYDGALDFGLIVEFFFIISGFLCAYNSVRKKDLTLFQYLKSVIKAIYPTVFLSIVVMWFLRIAYYLAFGEWFLGVRADIFNTLASIMLLFSGGAVDSGLGINNPLWYICVLIICQTIFFLSLKHSEKTGVKIQYYLFFVCLLGLGIRTYGINLPFANLATSRGYYSFFFGALLFDLYKMIDINKLSIISLFVLFLCGLFVIIDYSAFFRCEWGSMTFVVFPSVLFVALKFNDYLNYKSIGVLSGISMQIYIWHSLMIEMLCVAVELNLVTFGENQVLFMAGFIFLVVVLSVFIYFFGKKRIDNSFYAILSWILETK